MPALLLGALTHCAGLWAVVSGSDDWGLIPSILAIAAYIGGLVVLARRQPVRVALAVVIGESVAAVALGMVIGGFDNEAWGSSILVLTLVAMVVLGVTAALSASRRVIRNDPS
jgi:peptidoglycan/LPS O-acetylase OafA/YrhL